VHVLVFERPRERSVANFLPDLRKPFLDRREIGPGQLCLPPAHACVRDRAIDVELREPLVELHGAVKRFNKIADRSLNRPDHGFDLPPDFSPEDICPARMRRAPGT